MNKKYLVRGIISIGVFAFFFVFYWFIIAMLYSFFNFQYTTFNNWLYSLKIKNNLLCAIYLVGFTFILYLLFLFNLRFNTKNKSKVKYRKQKSKASKEIKNINADDLIFLNRKIGLVKSKINQHTVIVGGSGYGKTTTAKKIINQLANKLDQTVIIIDGKGDKDLINEIKLIDANAFVWTIGGTTLYNPLYSKNHIILADKIMSLFEFTEPHYEATAHDYLLLATRSMNNNKIQITMENIIKYFSANELFKIIDKDLDNDKIEDLINFDKRNISSLKSRLSIYKEQLSNSIGLENNLDKIVKNHRVILFSLDSLSYPKLASSIGKLIIQDLKEYANTKNKEKEMNIILDEFNVFATETVINLINKGRSFNYQCFLCFQVLKDLEIKNKNLTDIIFGNTANIIAHKIKDPTTAEYVAKVFGTRTSEKITKQYDRKDKNSSKGSIREVEEYIVHPNDLKNLKTGEVYIQLLLPSSSHVIEKIKIEVIK